MTGGQIFAIIIVFILLLISPLVFGLAMLMTHGPTSESPQPSLTWDMSIWSIPILIYGATFYGAYKEFHPDNKSS